MKMSSYKKIIQIGANYGDDDLANYIKSNLSHLDFALFVEANSIHIPKLKECYKNYENAIIKNIAIKPPYFEENELTIYYHTNDGPQYGISSCDIKHIQKHQEFVPYLRDGEIKSFTVPCITLEQLFDEYKIKDLDWLLLDVEGIDAELILTFNWQKYNIKRVEFEHLHLGEYKDRIKQLFLDMGYQEINSLHEYDWAFEKPEKTKNIKVLFFGRSKKEDLWEYDYITNDILGKKELSTSFLYLDDIRNCDDEFDVFVYSARDPNNYPWGYIPTFDEVLECVKKTKPKIVVQLSDEFWFEDLQIHNTISDHCDLFLRQYHHKNYSYSKNTKIIPIGYYNGFNNNKKILKIEDRKYSWSFVGEKKSDRVEMIESFNQLQNNFCHLRSDDNKISQEKLEDLYLNSIFIPCGRGYSSLYVMRIYESCMHGAIPVVVGSKEEIEETFCFEENPPWLFFNSWESAAFECKKLLTDIDRLQKIQDNILYWWNNRICKIKDEVDSVFYPSNKLDGICSINCITLKESYERRKCFVEQFKRYGVENKIYFHFSEKFGDVKEVLEFENKFENKSCDGNKSIFVSHLKNIKRWYENTDEEYALFCEDDLSIDTVEHWNFSWLDLINHLPSDWECVQLTCTGELFNSNFIKLHLRKWYLWGLQSFLVKRSYAKKLLDTYYKDDGRISMIVQEKNPVYYKGMDFWEDFHKYPYAENLILNGLGKVYSFSVFTENTEFDATFFTNGDNKLYPESQKPGHITARNTSIDWWKTEGFKMKIKGMTERIKVVDYFTYFDETGRELLDLRINLLKDYVDQFVIVESNRTHSGNLTKPGLRDAIEKYNLPKEKIRIIDLIIPSEEDLVPEEIDYKNCYENNAENKDCLLARVRERLQKDAFMSILDDYDDDCMIIHSDNDEIINPKYIKDVKNVLLQNKDGYVKIPIAYLQGRADLRTYDKNNNVAIPWGFFASNVSIFKRTTPIRVRSDKEVPDQFYILYMIDNNGNLIEDMGWHFSWMGNYERKQIKAKSFAHYNDNLSFLEHNKYENEIIKKDYYEGSIPPSGNTSHILKKYSLSDLPKIIFENERMKNFFLPKESDNNNKFNFSVNKEPKTSIIVCENFYEDPDAVREYALSLDFVESDYHRGRRTHDQHVFPGIKEKFEQLMGKKITRWTETYGMCGRFQYCTAEDAIVYHADSQQWAAVVYLTPDAPYETGTSLLVHKKTGTRHCSDPGIWDAWQETAPTGLYLDGTPWDDIDRIGNVYNRLIIWDGHCPHAASKYFGFTKETSRLFHIFFFDTDETPSWVN